MSNRNRATSIVLGGLAALGMLPAAAWGTTTVSYSSSTGLSIQGDSASEGVEARLPSENSFEVRALVFPGATLVAGSGCQKPAPSTVTCAIGGNRVVNANLGNGADELRWTTSRSTDLFVNGGNGNDRLSGGLGVDLLNGGPGDDVLSPGDEIDDTPMNDVLEGGDGNDLFLGDFGGTDTMRGGGGNDTLRAANRTGPLADLFDGGDGIDIADYSSRTQPVSLDVTTSPTNLNDGAPGEGDDLDNVETLIGGSGDDTLMVTSFASSNTKRTLLGNGGADRLSVHEGVRRSFMDGGAGPDTVSAGTSPFNEATIFSRDGEKDTITCGQESDTVTADLRDLPLPSQCENVVVSNRREGPNVVFRNASVAVDEDGVLAVRLVCPRSVRIGCKGALSARLDRSGTRFGARERYSLGPGDKLTVEVKLPAGQVAKARRPGARVRVRSVERGVHGPKTTQRSLPTRRG